MVEGVDERGIVRAYAATEQEGRVAIIAGEHAPVELLAIAADRLALRIEEEKVGKARVVGSLSEVVGCGDVEGLDETGSCCGATAGRTGCAEFAEILWRLRAMQLDVVEGEVGGYAADL